MNGITSVDYNSGNSVLGSTPALGYAIGATLHGMSTGSQIGITFLGLLNPAIMGAGVYHDSLTLHVCQDSACTKELTGSPLVVPVTYTITGNTIPNAAITAYSSVQVESPSNQKTAASASITIQGGNLPPSGAYVTIGASASGLITQTSFSSTLASNGLDVSTVTLSVSLAPPSSLGPGIHTDTFPINVCFDSACTRPAQGSPWTGQVTYIVDPVAGVDYTQKSINLSVGGMVWDSQTGKLYAIIPGYSALDPNTLAQINPSSATIDSAVQLNGGVGHIEPGTLAVSDDGQYLYVAVSDASGLSDHIEICRRSRVLEFGRDV